MTETTTAPAELELDEEITPVPDSAHSDTSALLYSLERRQDRHRRALNDVKAAVNDNSRRVTAVVAVTTAQQVTLADIKEAIDTGFGQILLMQELASVDMAAVKKQLGLTEHKAAVTIEDLRLVRIEAIKGAKLAQEAWRQSSTSNKAIAAVAAAFEKRLEPVRDSVADLKDIVADLKEGVSRTGKNAALSEAKADVALEKVVDVEARVQSHHDMEAEAKMALREERREERVDKREDKRQSFELRTKILLGVGGFAAIIATAVIGAELQKHYGHTVLPVPVPDAPHGVAHGE